MLTVIRSSKPTIPTAAAAWPAEAAQVARRLHNQGYDCLWIAPTERRLRDRRLAWPTGCTPRFHTFRQFVSLALSYTPDDRRLLDATERLPRLARAWQAVSGRVPGGTLVQSLDRLVYDWQICGVPAPSEPADLVDTVVRTYLDEL